AWEDSLIQGYDLYTTEVNDNNFVSGEWFLVEFNSKETGDCKIGFYDYNISWTEPQQYIELSNVPTRNLNEDPNQYVNFSDFSIFASKWGNTGCIDPNWCEGVDLDRNNSVDYNDLALFVEYWLWNVTYLDAEEAVLLSNPPLLLQETSAGTEQALLMETTTSSGPDLGMTPEELREYLKGLWNSDADVRKKFSRVEWKEFVESCVEEYETYYNGNNN
ncbi:MAG: hypothetical protein ACYST2_02255, partial [Planctomycetota bacterium]